jgi:hypothetical protein
MLVLPVHVHNQAAHEQLWLSDHTGVAGTYLQALVMCCLYWFRTRMLSSAMCASKHHDQHINITLYC